MNLRLISATLLAATLWGCDSIKDDERYIAVDPVVPARVVLIEDFTGQNCLNCPNAHTVIEQLQEQYPGAVVAVSIHAGDFAISKEYTYFDSGYIGLMTDEGNTLNNSWGIDEWPKGVINRQGPAIKHEQWAEKVRSEIALEADVNIQLSAALSGQDVKVDVTLEPLADIDGRLVVWIVESGIVARQRNSDGSTIKDYVHNNVFRAAITDLDGQAITLKKGIHTSDTYSIALRYNEQERWQPENLSVVAFVTASDGVHQAAITPVEIPQE